MAASGGGGGGPAKYSTITAAATALEPTTIRAQFQGKCCLSPSKLSIDAIRSQVPIAGVHQHLKERISCNSGDDGWSSSGHHLKRKMGRFIAITASIVLPIPSLVCSSSFSSYMRLAEEIQSVVPWSTIWCLFWLIVVKKWLTERYYYRYEGSLDTA